MEKRYLTWSPHSRQRLYFRGQADSDWRLTPTIDRLKCSFSSDDEREDFLTSMIEAFQKECYGLTGPDEYPKTPEEWEFLGRHHGLPTTILDWTQSPYAAAYFAFEESRQAEFVSVWVLHTHKLDFTKIDGIQWDSFEDTIRFNIRAAEQRGASMRVKLTDPPVEEVLQEGLLRLDIPSSERKKALIDLDEMLVNRRTLYRDLEGAARVATLRMGAE